MAFRQKYKRESLQLKFDPPHLAELDRPLIRLLNEQ